MSEKTKEKKCNFFSEAYASKVDALKAYICVVEKNEQV